MGFTHVAVAGQINTTDPTVALFCAKARSLRLTALAVMPASNWGEGGASLQTGLAAVLAAGWDGVRVADPGSVTFEDWSRVITAIRTEFPDAVLIADTVGVKQANIVQLAATGFDAMVDSGAWWDGKAAWHIEQRNAIAIHCRPVSFLEDPAIGRLADRLTPRDERTTADQHLDWYLWTVGHAGGVIVAMGFEFGSHAPLDPALPVPRPWDEEINQPAFDLSAQLNSINTFVQSCEPLQEAGRIMAVPDRLSTAPVVLRVTVEQSDDRSQGLLVLAGGGIGHSAPSPAADQQIAVARGNFAADGVFGSFVDCTPPVDTATGDSVQGLSESEREVREAVHTRWLRGQAASSPSRKSNAIGKRSLISRLQRLAPERVVIESVAPVVDGGRFAAKAIAGDLIEISADIFRDGHDKLSARVRVEDEAGALISEAPMSHLQNDRWTSKVRTPGVGRWAFRIQAWRDALATWEDEAVRKHAAGLDLTLEFAELAQTLAAWREQTDEKGTPILDDALALIGDPKADTATRLNRLRDAGVLRELQSVDPREMATTSSAYGLQIDRPRAAFSAWYELFPRSAADDITRHGTFNDVIDKLPYIRSLGFDVLYFPPVHPIGLANRKGPNNALRSSPGDPGSPYAIGSADGGHTELHPELGNFEDFERLIQAARRHGMEVALDFAIQCSPDHPWIRDHPEWFDWRADGSLKFAENPPKKYEDISNVSFYKEGAIPSLWLALRAVVVFWARKGVRIFRVDNPHTKPFPFWEWLISTVLREYPDVVFLAEAFTRPKVMARLAKLGFTQSYSYFTWRNEKAELQSYMTELTQSELAGFMRPNFFVNTPDINPYYLQSSGRAGFVVRATLAATLATSWGMVAGYELCEAAPVPGREEYLDSEKYQLRARDWDMPGNIRAEIARLNQIRQANPALWQFTNLQFLNAWNPQILAYAKWTDDRSNLIVVAVNLDPHNIQTCEFEIPLWQLGLDDSQSVYVDDLIVDTHATWTGKVQVMRLDPSVRPIGIWRLTKPGQELG